MNSAGASSGARGDLQASRIWENGEMRFAPNHLYIEEYVKCVNCGVLIYEKAAAANPEKITKDGKVYCSQWCVDWEQAREAKTAGAVNS
jgi:hypothetical protein